MSSDSENKAYSELYMGFRIRMRDGIYIALPQDWSQGSDETIVAADLETIRQEIRRWWYQIGA